LLPLNLAANSLSVICASPSAAAGKAVMTSVEDAGPWPMTSSRNFTLTYKANQGTPYRL
jgi:hypothetical protein